MVTPAIIFAAANAAAPEGSGGLPQLNPESFAPQLVWLALTYAVLYAALSWFILPRIGNVLEERRTRIQRDLDEAERLKQETEAAIAGYEQALAEARNKASTIAKETRDRLAAETDKKRAEVEAAINAKVQDAEARITAMKDQAMSEVDGIATETAGEIINKLVGGSVYDDEIRAAMAPSAQPAGE